MASSGLTSITIGNSVTSIGEGVFVECTSLEYIVVDADNSVYDSRENCNAIIATSWNSLMHGCKNTIIPNSVKGIGKYAFGYCYDLTSITIPSSVTTIGNCAFVACRSLISITIGNSVTKIGADAFSGCSGLTSVTIGNGVTTIGNNAFSSCYGLTSVTIGNSVTKIGADAFSKCSALKDFYCPTERIPTTGNRIFDGVKLSSATLHVPAASLQKYGSTYPWYRFGQIVALTESDGIKPLTSEANSPTTVYSLDGRRVAKPRKGIYVIGGRKTAVR